MADKTKKIDAVDTKIIKLLQINARTTASDIAENIGMSVPAVSERLRKLENAGIIERYTAILNNSKLGKEVMAIMLVAMGNPDLAVGAAFRDLVTSEPDVLECYSVTGEYDYRAQDYHGVDGLAGATACAHQGGSWRIQDVDGNYFVHGQAQFPHRAVKRVERACGGRELPSAGRRLNSAGAERRCGNIKAQGGGSRLVLRLAAFWPFCVQGGKKQ